MNIPNMLTLIRFFLIPIFYIVYFSSMENSMVIAMTIFLISGVTDILDGYIARKYNLVTKWGTVLDPLADKLMILTVLFCLSSTKIIPFWIFILILVKEATMIIGGINLLKYKKVIPAKYYGKISTVLFYLSMVVMAFFGGIAIYILYAAILMTLFSFVNYLISFIRIRKDKQGLQL